MRTVQGELETALATILREPVELTVAGAPTPAFTRCGQVASFVTAAEVPGDLARRANGLGPGDIAVHGGGGRAGRFRCPPRRHLPHLPLPTPDPPLQPLRAGRALWWPHRVDHEALDACAEALLGGHDFTAFTPTQTDHVYFNRKISPQVESETATSSASKSPPTPSCATWSGSWSERCSTSHPIGQDLDGLRRAPQRRTALYRHRDRLPARLVPRIGQLRGS